MFLGSAAKFGDLSLFGLLFEPFGNQYFTLATFWAGFKLVLNQFFSVATFWATFSKRLANCITTFLAALFLGGIFRARIFRCPNKN